MKPRTGTGARRTRTAGWPLPEIGRDQLMALIDHTSAVIYMRDADGRYLLVNREYERLFGLRREDIVGLTDHDLFPVEVADAFRLNDRQALAGGVPIQMEEEAPGAAGPRTYLTVKFPLIDEAGVAYAVAGISTDITERVAAERQRIELEQTLRQAERLDSLGQLAGGIAHDFNNILAVIAGYADMLVEELGEGHPGAPDAASIRAAAARGGALTRQLLIFSRSEPSNPEMLDLNAVTTDMRRLLARTIGENIELRTVLLPDLPPIVMDRTKLEQVVTNAALNARAAMPTGGRLTISTAVEHDGGGSDQVCLAITDTGSGMPPEVLARAFEPFFTTRGRGGGTGLGLATAYGVVTDAGGTISLESDVGRGTTLRIRMPVGAESAPGVSPVAPTAPVLAGTGRRILVVEDEEAVRDIVCRLLGKSGYEVFSAPNPAEALRMYRTEQLEFDVLLTDVIMPGMSGTQLAAELRTERPELPVVFMSGYTSGPAPGGQELPADDPLIRKPFESQTLLNEVHRVLA